MLPYRDVVALRTQLHHFDQALFPVVTFVRDPVEEVRLVFV